MRLKRYLQFIKESLGDNSMYWIDEEQIKDIFQYVTDEGYPLSITKVFFGNYGITSGYSGKFYDPSKSSEDDRLILFDTNDDDVVLSGQSYNPGWRISIVKGQYSGDDVTDEFRSAISQLKGEGYIIDTIEDKEGKTNLENIHLLNGSIITWISEIPNKPFTTNQDEMSDGDIYTSSDELSLLVHQSEKIKLTEKMLAEIYEWECDRIEVDKIYCHVDIDDMAVSILSRSDYERWGKTLGNESIDIDYYSSDGYYPDINSVFQSLKTETAKLLVSSMIKELGGLESLLIKLSENEIHKSLVDKVEDEVIDMLIKERFYRGLGKLSEESEIMDLVRETISDWEREAHCDKNWIELISEFDDIVSEVADYNKKFDKEVEKHYFRQIPGTENKEKVYYKTNVAHYELPFQDKWIEDYGKSLKGYSLDTLFQEWCSDSYQSYKLEPRFSDWGDVDSEDLNSEIMSILNSNSK